MSKHLTLPTWEWQLYFDGVNRIRTTAINQEYRSIKKVLESANYFINCLFFSLFN